MQQTYVMIKPDAVSRGLVGEVIKRIEQKGLKIVDMKMFMLTKEVLAEHYSHLTHLGFYTELEQFMLSNKVVGMIVEGHEAVATARRLAGPTKFAESQPGTIRGDFSTNVQENIVHTSDSEENAQIEIKRFFD